MLEQETPLHTWLFAGGVLLEHEFLLLQTRVCLPSEPHADHGSQCQSPWHVVSSQMFVPALHPVVQVLGHVVSPPFELHDPVVIAACLQVPVVVSHESVVQTLLSLQSAGVHDFVPAQVPSALQLVQP